MRNGPKPDSTTTDVPDLRVASSLTEVERKILDYMVLYLRTNTYQPSIREIGEQFGIKSTKTVSEHLQALADKGFLERDPSRSRGVRIVGMDLNAQTVSVPCYRNLPEMENGFRTDGAEVFMSLDRRFVAGKGCFMVEAPGDQLKAIDVGDGDMLVIEPVLAEELIDGEVVVARVGETPDYYSFRKTGAQVFLHPIGTDEAAVAVDGAATLGLVGRVSGLYRRMSPLAPSTPTTAH
ncbi:MAG: S24 family peptidase [Longimicrobiales bacterium]